MMIAYKDAREHPGHHIASCIVLRPFRRLLEEDALAEPDKALAEISPPEPLPSRHPVLSDVERVDEEADVLDQPGREGVSRGNFAANPLLSTQLDGSEKPSDGPNPALRPSIGRALVLRCLLGGHVLHR